MHLPFSRRFRYTLALVLALGLRTSLHAQTANLIQHAVDNQSRTPLKGTVHPLVAKSNDLGRAPSSTPMQRMVLLLKRSTAQEQALTSLMAGLQDKDSAQYHKWLTPAQFGQQFGVSDEDLAVITGWLQQQGFKVESTGNGKQWIEFSGTAGQVETAFSTQIHSYTYKNEKHTANASEISLPEALAPAVRGVLSLNDFIKKPSIQNVRNLTRNKNGQWIPTPTNSAGKSVGTSGIHSDLTFDSGSNGDGVIQLIAPGDLRTIYNAAPIVKAGTDGSGIHIAIVGRSNIQLSDIQTFGQIFGEPAQLPNIITNGADPGDVAYDDEESTLDVEWAAAAAPKATIDFVQSATTNTTDGVDLSAIYIVDNRIAPIMSTSYGECELMLGSGNAFYNALWEQAAAEGITSIVSSGDSGASSCDQLDLFTIETYGQAVSGLASTPYNVAIGGTMFNEPGPTGTYWSGTNAADQSSALGYIPETIWNESCDATQGWCPPEGLSSLAASGGGPSSCSVQDSSGKCLSGTAKPTWQTGIGVPPDGVRDVPDLSLNAAGSHDGYAFCFQSSCLTETDNGQLVVDSLSEVGGTSAAAPSFAGMLALIEEQVGTYQGQINNTLYQLYAATDPTKCDTTTFTDPTTGTSCLFYDITTGSNYTPQESGYHATTGYDYPSGIGSVNLANLIAAWPSTVKLNTTTTATASATSITHGQSVNINIAVAPASGTGAPSGDVSLISDKYGAVGSATLSNGVVNASVTNLPGGQYNLTVHYAGDATFAASDSAPIALNVKTEDAKVKISAFTLDKNGNPINSATAAYGDYIAVRADLSGASAQGIPSGTIIVYDNGNAIGSYALNSLGYAIAPTGYSQVAQDIGTPIFLAVGTHAITVGYSGDNSFNALKASSAYAVTISKASPVISTGPSIYSVQAGVPTLYNASFSLGWVASSYAPAPPTGTVQFYDNRTPIGDPQPIVLNGYLGGNVPVAVVTATLTAPGSHAITATYTGDANYTSGTVGYQEVVQVNSTSAAVPKVTMTASPTNAALGQVVTYSITVAPDATGHSVPNGTITVSGSAIDYYVSLYSAIPLINGKATFSSSAIAAGSAQAWATYNGNTTYASTNSAPVNINVAKATPTIALATAAQYLPLNTQTVLTVQMSNTSISIVDGSEGLDATGMVQFFDSVNGGSAQPLGIAHPLINNISQVPVNLPAGTNILTAQYLGNANWNAVTSAPSTIVVTAPDFLIATANPTINLAAGGSTSVELTITPLAGFNQPINLTCGSGLPAGVSCSFSPATINPNGAPTTTTLTLTSQGPFTTQSASSTWMTVAPFSLSVLAILFLPRRRRYPWLALVLVALIANVGCGGSGSPKPSALTLTTSVNTVASGGSVSLSATLVTDGAQPTGTVTFLDGTNKLGQQPISSGGAALSTSSLTIGTHVLTAQYSGDKHYDASTAAPVYQAITGSSSVSISAVAGSDTHALPLTINLQ